LCLLGATSGLLRVPAVTRFWNEPESAGVSAQLAVLI
jgi:hypothetical protein